MRFDRQYRALRELQDTGIREGIIPPECFVGDTGILYYAACLYIAFPVIFIAVKQLVGILKECLPFYFL